MNKPKCIFCHKIESESLSLTQIEIKILDDEVIYSKPLICGDCLIVTHEEEA